jgi:hypothetical protein
MVQINYGAPSYGYNKIKFNILYPAEYFYREQHQALVQDAQTDIFDRYRLIALTNKNTALIYNTLLTSRSLTLSNNEIHQLTLFHSGLSLPACQYAPTDTIRDILHMP